MGLDEDAELPFAIAEVGRHEEFALAADPHAHQAQVPALDHQPGADHALEGLAALVGRVEAGAILQETVVLGADQGTFDHFLTLTQLDVDHLQFVVHHSHSSRSPANGRPARVFSGTPRPGKGFGPSRGIDLADVRYRPVAFLNLAAAAHHSLRRHLAT